MEPETAKPEDNILKRGINPGSNLCPLCKDHMETRDHLMCTCRLSLAVRRAVNRWWDVLPEHCNDVPELLKVLRLPKKMTFIDTVKEAIVEAYCWLMWKRRNDVVFNDRCFHPLITANDIQSVVYS